MCRLYGFRGSAPSRLDCSLVRAQNALMAQSRRDHRGLSNADGWGISFYEAAYPVVEKCDSAAYQDLRFAETAARITSRTVLAHVRKATVGGTSVVNTHPFSNGIWSFAHNGTLTGFDRIAPWLEGEIRPDLLSRRRGTTDSELIFLWLLTRMRRAGIATDRKIAGEEPVVAVFVESIPQLAAKSEQAGADEPAKLNLLLTDGVTLVASRWGNSLYRLRREGVHDCEICGLPHVERPSAAGFKAALVASEPITSEEWREVPERSVVAIGGDAQIRAESVP